MKKTIFATLTAAVVAGTIAMLAPAAEAGELRIVNHGWFDVQVQTTDNSEFNGSDRGTTLNLNEQISFYSQYYEPNEPIIVDLQIPGYEPMNFTIPQGADDVTVVELRGTLFNAWADLKDLKGPQQNANAWTMNIR